MPKGPKDENSFTIAFTKWNIRKTVLYGALFGLIVNAVKTYVNSPDEVLEFLAFIYGGLIGGALGGALLFAIVTLVRNWMVGRQKN